MIDIKKHHVFFSIEHRIDFGQAIYIKGNIPELANPIKLDVLDDTWSTELHIDPNQQVPNGKVTYEYFIAPWDGPIHHEIKIDSIDSRSFQISKLRGHRIKIVDKYDKQHWEQRETIQNPNMMIHHRLAFKHHVNYGEAIYVIGCLEELDRGKPENSVRMEWTEGDVWKTTLSIDVERIIACEGRLTLMFIKSYYYKREKTFWVIVGNAKSVNRCKAGSLDGENSHPNVPYVCEMVISEDIAEYLEPDAAPLMLKFKFTELELDRNVKEVYMIFEEFGRVKLVKEDGVWQVELWVTKNQFKNDDLKNFKFYFEFVNDNGNIHATKPVDMACNYHPLVVYDIPITKYLVIPVEVPVNHDLVAVTVSQNLTIPITNQSFQNIAPACFLNSNRTVIAGTPVQRYQMQRFNFNSMTQQSRNYNRCKIIRGPSEKIVESSFRNTRLHQRFGNIGNSTVPHVSKFINNYGARVQAVTSSNTRVFNGVCNFMNGYGSVLRQAVSRPNLNYSIRNELGTQNLLNDLYQHKKTITLTKREIEVIQDDCEKIIEKLVEGSEPIKQFLKELKDLNDQEADQMKRIYDTNFKMFKLEILVLVKHWGLTLTPRSSENGEGETKAEREARIKNRNKLEKDIGNKLNIGFNLAEVPKEEAMQAFLEVNKYCKKIFAPNVKHANRPCQADMQSDIPIAFGSYGAIKSDESNPLITEKKVVQAYIRSCLYGL
jgi:hypothetical protein